MPALNAPGIDVAPPDRVPRPCTGPGAARPTEPVTPPSSAMRSTCSVVDESRYSSPQLAHIIACASAQHKTAGVRLVVRVRLWFFCAGEGVAYILDMS